GRYTSRLYITRPPAPVKCVFTARVQSSDSAALLPSRRAALRSLEPFPHKGERFLAGPTDPIDTDIAALIPLTVGLFSSNAPASLLPAFVAYACGAGGCPPAQPWLWGASALNSGRRRRSCRPPPLNPLSWGRRSIRRRNPTTNPRSRRRWRTAPLRRRQSAS